LREIYGEVIQNAFDAGIADAWAFWDMTPAEISGRLRAHRVTANQRMEESDALAWMVGSYVAQGYHQPKKYPKHPDMVTVKDAKPVIEMDDENIKTVLTAYAEIHNTIEGAK